MSIRPVSRRLPSSQSVWEETNLPMCVVVTPFEELDDDYEYGDAEEAKEGSSNKVTTAASTNSGVNAYFPFAQPISAVPKCLSCGAPHPTNATHFRPSRLSSRMLCYFCGETSSTMLTDQQDVRTDEYLDPDTYDKIPFPGNKKNNESDDESVDDDDDETDCLEFRVPVEVKKLKRNNNNNDGRNHGKKKGKGRHGNKNKNNYNNNNSPTTISTWQLPAMVCPPVWWIVVDGTVGGGRIRGTAGTSLNSCNSSLDATRNYWTTIGTTLSRTLEEIPPHVHVGLITATGSRLAIWDLTSAVPHVKQYPYSYDPTTALSGGLVLSDVDGDKNEKIDTTDADDSDSFPTWDLCLVPANGLYKANLEAAIRAMVDGAISGVFQDESSSTDDDDDEEKKGQGNDDDGVVKSSGIPLGLTLEIILEFMEQATHPGQDNNDDDDDDGDDDSDDDDDDGEKKKKKKTELRYAGGKILCLLGNPPLETAAPANDSMSYVNQSKFYQGGVAGECFEGEEEEDEEEKHNSDSDDGGGKKKKKHGGNNKKKKSKKRNKKFGVDNSSPPSPPKNDDKDGIVDEDRDLTDLTPSNLQDYAMPLDPDDLFVTIGRRCALAALGVDLFVLVPEEDDEDPPGRKGSYYGTAQQRQHIPWYGLPLLRPLSEFSGAPGPLMFGTAKKNSDDDDDNYDSLERLHENLLARTPWQAGMVFGAQMRLRLSPGFQLESTPIEGEPNSGELQLAPFLTTGGLTGPATTLSPDDDAAGGDSKDDDVSEDNEGLWIMGTCDPHTSFTIDLETDGEEEVPDSCEMEGFGVVDLKPVMQTCTLFTCVETDGAEPIPNYYTVCKMRVTSVSLSLADDAESIYDALDPEALSVVLYHKIALDAYLTGLVDAQKTCEEWIQSLMVCVYQSALQKQAEIEEERMEQKQEKLDMEQQQKMERKHRGPRRSKEPPPSSDEEDEDDDDEEDGTSGFVVCERLLDEEGGDLEEEEVLMGQGHSKIGVVPLLMFAIMQSDALRPSDGTFQPSMDARLCASTQMASMTPKALAKTFAPSLSLWSIKNDEPILESLPLSYDGILSAIGGDDDDDDEDKKTNNIDEEDGILLLESPQRLTLFRASDLQNIDFGRDGKARLDNSTGKRKPIKFGSELESTILSALNGFRTSPPQSSELEGFLDNQKGGDLDDIQVTPSAFLSMLLEDKPTFSGDRDFIEWKSKIAELVREDVEADDDDEDVKPASGFRRFLPFGKK
jgi:hypothetical protein